MPCENVTVTIYDAIVNMQDGWKCSKTCGIFDGMFDAIPDEDQSEEERVPDEFDCWFADLLEVPWGEYFAFDDQLENESPPEHPQQLQQNTDLFSRWISAMTPPLKGNLPFTALFQKNIEVSLKTGFTVFLTHIKWGYFTHLLTTWEQHLSLSK